MAIDRQAHRPCISRPDDAVYVCPNCSEAYAREEIRDRSVCVNGDIAEIIAGMRRGNTVKFEDRKKIRAYTWHGNVFL